MDLCENDEPNQERILKNFNKKHDFFFSSEWTFLCHIIDYFFCEVLCPSGFALHINGLENIIPALNDRLCPKS